MLYVTVMSFGIALHILLALGYNKDTRLSSDQLATSICVNPVTVRRVLGQLSEAKLVTTFVGAGGGSVLAKDASQISVLDVYEALGEPGFLTPHGKCVYDACIVSVSMPQIFEQLNQQLKDASHERMKHLTLEELLAQHT